VLGRRVARYILGRQGEDAGYSRESLSMNSRLSIYIYLFSSRNKTKASSQRDMCLKQRIQMKVVAPNFLRAPQVRCAQVIGGRRTPYKENKEREKEKSTSKKRPEALAVTPGGRSLHFHHIFRLPRNPRIHPRGIRRLLVRSVRQSPSHSRQLKETNKPLLPPGIS
jgi:hypothetical protein